MRVAVIGGGLSGLGSAYVLAREDGIEEVVLFEKESFLGGQCKTMRLDGVDLDVGFFHPVTCPHMMSFFKNLGVDIEVSNMSFSVSLDSGIYYEWGTRNGLSSLFAQKRNILNPYFWQMITELIKFKEDALTYIEELERNPDTDRNETLGEFLKSHGYSALFQQAYLLPACGSIWPCPPDIVLNFSAYSILSFCRNHHLLQTLERPQWLTVAGRSETYVAKVRAELEQRGCKIRMSCNVLSVSTSEDGCILVTAEDGSYEVFEKCIIAVNAPDTLRLLGEDATFDETRVLGAFQYAYSDIYLHRDTDLMPRNPIAWSACNFIRSSESKASLTYWLNIIQNLGEEYDPYFLTINPEVTPKKTLFKWTTGHSLPFVSAWKASQELNNIQGKRGLWFCGAYQVDPNRVCEEGRTMFTFKGKDLRCNLESVINIHSPHFYWKVMTQADLGLADAYINGDFSFADKETGLLNLIMILIANKELNSKNSNLAKKRGWWTPMFITAGLASATHFLKHFSRQNTLTKARRNISRHYDLSNELFALFLDDTMSYSSGIFKPDDEDLKTAQMRKIFILIDKARVEKHHEVLEIGCGWGTLAIEVVRRTGCRYTGITLSIEQLKYAEEKVKEAGLEDRITFKLCDYRQLSEAHKYDRIISCEMIEHVGHEFMDTFFSLCEAALAENGIFVLQFISIPEERYNEYRLNSDFIKEYIFPGGCIPSLARVISAMASSSRLREIRNLGFDDKFIRTWEYYFDYCAAGFKTLTLEDYQVVFSRPGNVAAFRDPFRSFPSGQ
ncbi:unnamed protein product [Eruca vesicaria subsp. sativa]|uniref:Amine oxidase domain-containing protein n=1 Tax=Eruca vesicaria subsp. sativa TaxID=29727 RepID=A0ABC8KSX7_ERUVS|nr:unnamed protein product [Eruca vesicaria subsp. sativa]